MTALRCSTRRRRPSRCPSFGIYQGPATKVKMPEVSGYVKESIWHESQKITDEKDGSILFEAEVAGTDEIRFWVMSWGSKAEVLEPVSLREEVRTEAEAVTGIYQKGKKPKKSSPQTVPSAVFHAD